MCVCVCLSVEVISLYVGSYLCFPLVSVVEELLLVVEQFLMGFSGELEVGTLYDSVHRTRLLTEAAVDAFGHVNVVASRPPAAISTSLCFDADGLGWTDSFTQLAGDATLLS